MTQYSKQTSKFCTVLYVPGKKEKEKPISQAAAQPQPVLPPGNARDLVSFSITLILEKETGAIGWRKRGESGSYHLDAYRLSLDDDAMDRSPDSRASDKLFQFGWENCPTQRPESFLPLAELGFVLELIQSAL
jgi:hypothetical protein